jgi:hypothetical protein
MSDHDEYFKTNKEFQNELKKLFSPPESVSPEFDRKIMEMADKHFARRQKSGRIVILRWAGRAVAAAAVVFITLLVYFQFESAATLRKAALNKQAAVVREAVNLAGKVTILDAFTLARNIDAGSKIDKSWDLNHDGTIDKKDVDAVAFAAVRLRNGV